MVKGQKGKSINIKLSLKKLSKTRTIWEGSYYHSMELPISIIFNTIDWSF